MSTVDPIAKFEREIELRVTGELCEMLETAQDWIDADVVDWVDQDDDLIFVAYRNALEDQLAERDLDIETGENQ